MKKTLFLLLALAVVFTCAGCRGDADINDNTVDGTLGDDGSADNGAANGGSDDKGMIEEFTDDVLGTDGNGNADAVPDHNAAGNGTANNGTAANGNLNNGTANNESGGVSNDLESRPNARTNQAGGMDYQGAYPYIN